MDLERLKLISARTLTETLPPGDAVTALEASLRAGESPGSTPLRTVVEVGHGQLLLMPAEVGAGVGVKLVSVRGESATGDLPRIQGIYVLLDGASLEPLALVDGVALTLSRTSALSALAVRHLAGPGPQRLTVFGTGPQAWAHIEAIGAVRPLESVTVVGRREDPTRALVDRCREAGLDAAPGDAGSVRTADVVACCTTARSPLFDSDLLPDHGTVVAVGSHEPSAREVDTALVRRATVLVETRASALKEAGDVLLAIADGVPEDDAISGDVSELTRGRLQVAADRPRLFKSVGEAWGDLVLAGTAYARVSG